MNRIKNLFDKKNKEVLNVYCTAGYPAPGSTLVVMKALQEAGADLIELGMPYSDPLADGPVIQESSAVALRRGMTINRLFHQLEGFRASIQVPVILMGYLNPILQYGFDQFCARAAEAGIDGLIIPDIPMYEYETHYRKTVEAHGLDFIFLVTPETSAERIRKLDALSSGFLYAVSSSSLTGSERNFSEVEDYLKGLSQMNLKNPLLVGFGIRDRTSFLSACKYASGAIIGSAYIQALKGEGSEEADTRDFLGRILNDPPGQTF